MTDGLIVVAAPSLGDRSYLLTAGDLHMSELVARLGVTLPTVSGIVDRLVEHGLVGRRAVESDRRSFM